jgi:hypothetical protein
MSRPRVTVQDACDELWRCQDADQVLHRLKRVHRALLNDRVDTYDPSDTFLAIQGAALRFLPSQNNTEQKSQDHRSAQPSANPDSDKPNPDIENDGEKTSSEMEPETDDEAKEKTKELHWTITEESLLTAAALACVCVGPAWRSQIHQRRRWLAQRRDNDQTSDQSAQSNTWAPPDVLHVGTIRSYSPMTNSSISVSENLQNSGEDVTYPPVPEVLPAAMLRFAASALAFIPSHSALSILKQNENDVWEERKAKIAIGQRYLVLAICCEAPSLKKSHVNKTQDGVKLQKRWTIPGAHKLVGNMLVFWLELACPQNSEDEIQALVPSKPDNNNNVATQFRKDRWYTLAVSRATVDLVSTGWRPLPKSDVGPLIVKYLLGIAEKGISLRESKTLPEEDRLAASSSAAEAISALASLGNRGLIPTEAQQITTRTICRLHVISGLIKASIFQLNDSQAPESERTMFMTQIESCLADTADFLWILLGTQSSSANAMAALLDAVNAACPNAPTCLLFSDCDWNTKKELICRKAGTALHMMSVALWGRPSGVISSKHLRIYIGKVLGIIRETAASVHLKLHERLKVGDFVASSTCDLLSLALDTLVSLGNFTDQQLVGGGQLICSVEWDTFLLALEESFIPWFDYSIASQNATSSTSNEEAKAITGILERAHLEIQSHVLRIGAFLDKFVRFEGSPFHSIVTFESQKKLYLFILRTAIPYLDPTDGALLGLSVARAWVKFGLFPFKMDGWAQTATGILSEVFSIYESGRYAHSPQVRLAALKALVTAKHDYLLQSDNMDAGSIPSDGSPMSQISTLSVSSDVSDFHFQITTALIPFLHTILSETYQNPAAQRVIPLPKNGEEKLGPERGFRRGGLSSASPADKSSVLMSSTVKLVGMLVRDVSSDRERRARMLDLLRSVAMESKYAPFGSHERHESEAPMPHELLRLQGSVRLAAVKELEHCLEAPFGEMPQIHEIVPSIVESLCTLLTAYTFSQDNGDAELSDEWQCERMVLAFAALFSLCRLRPSCSGGKLSLISRGHAAQYIPDHLFLLLTRKGASGEIWVASQLAPFVAVADNDSRSNPTIETKRVSTMTTIAFEPVVVSIIGAVAAARRARDLSKPEINSLLQSLSSLGFHGLTSFFHSGYQLNNPMLFEKFIFAAGVETNAESSPELIARSRALAALTESAVARYSNKQVFGDEDAQTKSVDSLLDLLVNACDSTRQAESIAASRGVIAILPSLANANFAKLSGNAAISTIFVLLASRLQKEVLALDRVANVEHESILYQEIASLLAALHDIVNDAKSIIAVDNLLHHFDLCNEMIQRMLKRPSSYSLHLAIRCLIAILDRLPIEAVGSLISSCKHDTILDANLDTDNDSHVSELTYKDYFSLTADFIELLIPELLEHRLQMARSPELNVRATDEISFHEELALELDNMERFEVEEHGVSGEPLAAVWLCEESLLLSCRVGSSTSRHRGWVELVIRRPTFRKRTLVRLLSKISIGNPDMPSTLWSSLPSSLSPDGDKPSPDSAMKYDTENILQKYECLVARFDSFNLPTCQDNQNSSVGASFGVEKSTATTRSDGSPLSQLNRFSQTGVDSSRNAKVSGQLSHAAVTGHLAVTDAQKADKSIHGWLRHALKNDDNVKDVVGAIRKLGFSDDIIRGGILKPDRAEGIRYGKKPFSLRRLQAGPKLDRAIVVLDRTTPSNTHKMALLYAGPLNFSGTTNPETILLSTKHCSSAFHRFAEGLGKMVSTKHLRYFSAGLDVSSYESDGHYTRAWVGHKGSILPSSKTIVVYHVVHLMPEGINSRKRHVGNDNVLIIYVDKDSPIAIDVDLSDDESKNPIVSGHFGFVTIYISMLPQPDVVRVTVRIRHGLPDSLRQELIVFAGNDIIAIQDAPEYVRGVAIRADLACRSVLDNLAPASNSYERYCMLREMARHAVK